MANNNSTIYRKKHIATAVALTTALLCSSSAFSKSFDEKPYEKVTGKAVDDKLSYELGGGAAYGAASSRIRPPFLGFGIRWKSDMMCGNMDLKTTVRNQLNGATDGFKNLMGDIVQGASGAVASLPALIIQRANPGLYELLSNGVLQGRIDFDRSKLTCKGMLDQVGSYMDSTGLETLAKAESMGDAVKSTDGDAVAAVEKAEERGTENGVEWMGEKRGGVNQQPLRLTEDVAKRAFNTMNGRTGNNTSKVTTAQCNGAAICSLWSSPQEAAEFATTVVGEAEVMTCKDGCDPANISAGTGLLHMADEVYEKKAEVMERLLTQGDEISEQDLAELSTPMLPVSRQVIMALRDDPDGDLLSQRLLSEISLADMMWKGIQLNRLLMTGAQDPDVQRVSEAKTHVSEKIAALQSEMDSMRMEMELRKSLANNTAMLVLERRTLEGEMSSSVRSDVDMPPMSDIKEFKP